MPIDTSVFNDLLAQINKLSPDERLRMISLLAMSLQPEFIDKTDWHARLLTSYGILTDDPIERPPQPPLETREPID
jgi:hypothetical protein